MEYYKRTEISELKSDLKEKDVKIPLDVNVVYNSYYVPDNKIVFDKINSAVNSEGETNIKNIKLLDNNGDGKPDIMFVICIPTSLWSALPKTALLWITTPRIFST